MIEVTHLGFDGREARALIDVDGSQQEIFLRTNRTIPEPDAWGDVWAPFGLFPGMRLGKDARFNVAITWLRRRNLASAQKVLVANFPMDFARTRLISPVVRAKRQKPTGTVAQFFTGGVDSFYTLLTNPEVSLLVYAFDLHNEPPEVTKLLRPHLRKIAHHYGKELVEIEYNARISLDKYAQWGPQSFTGVLSSFAALLSRLIDEMVIPSQHPVKEDSIWGDHPEISEFWAPGRISYRHHAGDLSRFTKTSLVAKDSFASAHIRVCWQATDQLNCGTCEKCLRTRTSFEIIEKGFSSPAFPKPLDVSQIEQLIFPHDFIGEMWTHNLTAARDAGRTDVTQAIEKALANSSS